ncbi:MAG TPA: ATP-binding protein [Polyangiaceae bacterium]|nr:ATP-binding protein [Polyangiaceae bacterium]
MGRDRRPDTGWLLAFSRELRHVDGYDQLVELVGEELKTRFGLTNAWLYVFEQEEDEHAVLVAVAGPKADQIRKELPVAPIAGDWLIAALRRDEGPIIIPDARAVEGNPDVAQRLDNRTVVNMPIGVVDRALGILGGGTFGDEGPVFIDAEAVPYLVHLANMASVAVARLVLRAREAARLKLQARLAQRQRLEALGLLAGGVAHDFNNLLLVIRASLGFIGEGPLIDAQRGDLAAAQDAERSATALIKKLLMLGRHDAPAFEQADINQVVGDFLRVLERVIPATIQMDFLPGAGLPRLTIDPRQLEQVLMNLVLNGRDAMPNGGRLSLETQQVVVNGEYRRAHPWANAGRYVLLTIADSGCGMPPAVVERVFEPFFTTKPMGEGTGLGLAISWGIVHRHGGMIHCYSEVGVGTSFKIYLPAGEQAAIDVGTKIAGPVPRGTERVLAADDQENVLAVMVRVLSNAGYRVTGVSNGADAVAAAEKEAFDLYILDAVMPVMGGREACERIRSARPAARFLFVSGYGGEAMVPSFLEASRYDMISKPFDPDALLRAVRATLDASSKPGSLG